MINKIQLSLGLMHNDEVNVSRENFWAMLIWEN
jgi:hypothetical protein